MSPQQVIDTAHQELLELLAFIDAVDALCVCQQSEIGEPGDVVHALLKPVRQQLGKAIGILETRI